MPQPKVSSGPSRSKIVIAWAGSSFFMRMAKYRPAGPPPTTGIFMAVVYLRTARPHPRTLVPRPGLGRGPPRAPPGEFGPRGAGADRFDRDPRRPHLHRERPGQ